MPWQSGFGIKPIGRRKWLSTWTPAGHTKSKDIKMKNCKLYLVALGFGGLFLNNTFATNPFITDQFTADPTARVFEGRVYVYPCLLYTSPSPRDRQKSRM